ncbi:hypothetical protein [Actinomyces weissii]|nr:hypothetical protein [Actinomyces weissii]
MTPTTRACLPWRACAVGTQVAGLSLLATQSAPPSPLWSSL